jgi:hypothetical protein
MNKKIIFFSIITGVLIALFIGWRFAAQGDSQQGKNVSHNKISCFRYKSKSYLFYKGKRVNDKSSNYFPVVIEKGDGCRLIEWNPVHPASELIPFEVAVQIKQFMRQDARNLVGDREFRKQLNTPPEVSNPLYFYPEDVEALRRIGYKLGPKAKIIQKRSELEQFFNKKDAPSKPSAE